MINFHLILHFAKHFFSAKRKGHGIHSPFAYDLCEEVFYNENLFYDFDILKKVRNNLLKHPGKIEVTDFGAGSKTFKSNTRKIKKIADTGISSTLQSELFYKLINYLKFDTVIELGTSIGLNTLYLAKANTAGKVITIEGSKNLSEFSSQLAKENNIPNIEFISGKFDEVLPSVLDEIKSKYLLYVDGNHTFEATMQYFKMALVNKNEYTAIIFDDIYWSAGMTKAWNTIKNSPEVTMSIDAFYFGILFFKTSIKEKKDLRLFI